MKEELASEELSEILSVELENDELVRLVTSNADVASQYVIFQNIEDEYFAINVAKVEELVEYKTLNIVKTSKDEERVEGTAKIRDHFVNIVHFDKWLGIGESDISTYELAILCNYADTRLAIVIKNVYGVINIEPSEMFDDSDKDEKIIYLCEIVIYNKKTLCKVFDSDRFLADVMPSKFAKEVQKSEIVKPEEMNVIEKEILIAEDSLLIQNTMKKLFDKMQLSYRIFNNAQDLLSVLKGKEMDDVALIITDLEMPVMGGLELIEICSKHDYYHTVPIVVHTNMASSSITNTAKKIGAKEVVNKIDLVELKDAILKYAKR